MATTEESARSAEDSTAPVHGGHLFSIFDGCQAVAGVDDLDAPALLNVLSDPEVVYPRKAMLA